MLVEYQEGKMKKQKGFEVGAWGGMFYFGVSQTVVWFDMLDWFSVDMGKWYVRLYFRILDFSFCRYFGVIKCSKFF